MPSFSLKTYIMGGLGLVLALSMAWGLRVDHLRGVYHDRLEVIRVNLDGAGISTPRKDPGAGVEMVINQRDTYRAERDTARGLVEIQSASIERMGQETEDARTAAAANRHLAEEAARQRDYWIAQARSASTRTERLSAEEELAECEAVLDRLYSSGF